jgi:hypothetical protein
VGGLDEPEHLQQRDLAGLGGIGLIGEEAKEVAAQLAADPAVDPGLESDGVPDLGVGREPRLRGGHFGVEPGEFVERGFDLGANGRRITEFVDQAFCRRRLIAGDALAFGEKRVAGAPGGVGFQAEVVNQAGHALLGRREVLAAHFEPLVAGDAVFQSASANAFARFKDGHMQAECPQLGSRGQRGVTGADHQYVYFVIGHGGLLLVDRFIPSPGGTAS